MLWEILTSCTSGSLFHQNFLTEKSKTSHTRYIKDFEGWLPLFHQDFLTEKSKLLTHAILRTLKDDFSHWSISVPLPIQDKNLQLLPLNGSRSEPPIGFDGGPTHILWSETPKFCICTACPNHCNISHIQGGLSGWTYTFYPWHSYCNFFPLIAMQHFLYLLQSALQNNASRTFIIFLLQKQFKQYTCKQSPVE